MCPCKRGYWRILAASLRIRRCWRKPVFQRISPRCDQTAHSANIKCSRWESLLPSDTTEGWHKKPYGITAPLQPHGCALWPEQKWMDVRDLQTSPAVVGEIWFIHVLASWPGFKWLYIVLKVLQVKFFKSSSSSQVNEQRWFCVKVRWFLCVYYLRHDNFVNSIHCCNAFTDWLKKCLFTRCMFLICDHTVILYSCHTVQL